MAVKDVDESREAVRAFAQTAGELLDGEELSPADARRAAMVAAAGVVWERGLSPVEWAKGGKDPERLALIARRDARRFEQ